MQLTSRMVCNSPNKGFDFFNKTFKNRRGIQTALELVLKTSRAVKRMGIDTSPFCFGKWCKGSTPLLVEEVLYYNDI